MKTNVILSVIVILLLGALIVLVFQLPERITQKPVKHSQLWSDKDQLDYANTLLAKGLQLQAASVFEKYIETSNASKKEIARICYRLGNIYMDSHHYEKALALFYRAEMLDKEADFTQEMDQRIVEALEKLGLSSQAQYELAKRVSLGDTSAKRGEVVARIGKRDITQNEIDKAIAALPEWMRKRLEKRSQRLEFIRNYVATEVLYEKAKRLGIDKKAEIREALENTKKQLMVQHYLNKEIEQKLKCDPRDIENYYEANNDKYTEPARIKVRYVEFKEDSETEEALKELKETRGTEVKGWIRRGQSYISGIGEAKAAIEKLFLKEKGEYSDPLKIKDRFYIFSIEDKQPDRVKTFDEVRNQVEYEYRMQKKRSITDSLLKAALEEQEVEIFYKSGGDESPKK
ncbi:MAG: peptidyl-prolyl cis-trans isomerase [Deltaproteobacteria bacterium]|nr:peptidyl-prolyl cis-trans isomerase [Deltaproteobacteria bacterium]